MGQAQGFLLDSRFFLDEKFGEIRAKHGYEGVGIVLAVIGLMRDCSNYRLSITKVESHAVILGVPVQTLDSVLKTSIEAGLFAQEDSTFYAPALLKRMESFEKKRDAARTANAVRWGRRNAKGADTESGRTTNGLRSDSGRTPVGLLADSVVDNDNDNDNIRSKNEDLRINLCPDDRASLLMHFPSEQKLDETILAAESYLASAGKPLPKNIKAYLTLWHSREKSHFQAVKNQSQEHERASKEAAEKIRRSLEMLAIKKEKGRKGL